MIGPFAPPIWAQGLQSGHGSAIQLPVRDADVMALWQEAFDAAHSVAQDKTPQRDPRDPSATDANNPHSTSATAMDERSLEDTLVTPTGSATEPRSQPTGQRVQAPPGRNAVKGAETPSPRPVGQKRSVQDIRTSPIFPPLMASKNKRLASPTSSKPVPDLEVLASRTPMAVTRHVASDHDLVSDNERTQSAATATDQEAQSDPVPPESVLVYTGPNGLEVVVRQIGLEVHAALRCAQETAHHLVGDRAALYQVTLNGKTVYEGQRANSVICPGPTFQFTC